MAAVISGGRWRYVVGIAAATCLASAASASANTGMVFGFNEDPLFNSSSQVASSLAAAGAQVQRFTISWDNTQPTANQAPDFNTPAYPYRDYANALEAQGVRPLIVLGIAPPWARDRLETTCWPSASCWAPPGKNFLINWESFAAAAAAAFPDAVAFEIWNEPNLSGFWDTIGGPNPQRYADTYFWARRGIASVNASVPVLTGGVAYVTQDPPAGLPGNLSIPTFLRGFYNAGGAREMSLGDAIGVHIYPANADYHGSLVDTVLGQVRGVLSEVDTSRHMWVTETGITTAGPAPATPAAQADGLAQGYQRFLHEPDVDAMIIHRLRDTATESSSDPETGYGVLTSGFGLKPAYCRIASLRGKPRPTGCP